jgi:hypothetical protein
MITMQRFGMAALAIAAFVSTASAQSRGGGRAATGTAGGQSGGMCQQQSGSSGTTSTSTMTPSTSSTASTAQNAARQGAVQTALRQQALMQQAAVINNLRASGVTAASLQQQQANLQATLQRVNAMLATQQANPTLYAMQIQAGNPVVLGLLQRQLLLENALQQNSQLQSLITAAR